MKDIIYIVLFITLLITLQSSSCNKTDEPQTHCDSTNTVYLPEVGSFLKKVHGGCIKTLLTTIMILLV
jgi:hypothetical protein